MRPLNLSSILPILTCLFLSSLANAQVKIGGNPKENPHPSAVLELQTTDKGLLLPRLTREQMLAIKEPANALVIFNTDAKAVYIYNSDQQLWMPLLEPAVRESVAGLDSCEWLYDSTTLRVFLKRGYPLGDSIYYNIARRKFVFTDKINIEGSGTPADVFYPGKFIFKGNASQVFHDSASLNFPSITLGNFVFAVDNDSFALANPGISFYNGMRISTQMSPSATQTASTLRSLLLQVNHTGADTVFAVTGISNNAFVDGQGYTGLFTGVQNNMSISDGARNNVGTMIGYRNTMTMTSGAGGRVGNVFGYNGSINGFRDSIGNSFINGNAYGIFLNNVAIAGPHRNFAFYSNKGLNRLGDSTLITDQFITTPRAVLDVNATSAMIIPSGTSAQRPATGITAMFRNNTDLAAPEFFNGSSWQQLSIGASEWAFDAATNRVNLVRGLPAGDTIFYHNQTNQFVFSDRRTNTNSLGQDFPVENFGAKYTFKATASKRDSVQFNGSVMNIVYEADNSTNNTTYTALSTSAVKNPLALQKSDLLSGLSNTTIHAGNDSVQLVIGIQNNTRNSGNGKSTSLIGIQNAVRLFNGTANSTGEMVGFRNILTKSGTSTGRVTGNVYGIQQNFSGLANNVDGFMYGVFMNNVNGAGPRRNFAFYSNKGLNRLGDSVLITDGSSTTPRAVLDVNATSAMVVPTGTSAQRPGAATSVAGMVRYNTDNGGRLESYNGSAWSGIISGGIGIDPPNILVNSGITVSFAFAGATVGATVTISPSTAPPAGLIIAWARVSAANTVEVRFENNSGAALNPPSIGYNIRIIQ